MCSGSRHGVLDLLFETVFVHWFFSAILRTRSLARWSRLFVPAYVRPRTSAIREWKVPRGLAVSARPARLSWNRMASACCDSVPARARRTCLAVRRPESPKAASAAVGVCDLSSCDAEQPGFPWPSGGRRRGRPPRSRPRRPLVAAVRRRRTPTCVLEGLRRLCGLSGRLAHHFVPFERPLIIGVRG